MERGRMCGKARSYIMGEYINYNHPRRTEIFANKLNIDWYQRRLKIKNAQNQIKNSQVVRILNLGRKQKKGGWRGER